MDFLKDLLLTSIGYVEVRLACISKEEVFLKVASSDDGRETTHGTLAIPTTASSYVYNMV